MTTTEPVVIAMPVLTQTVSQALQQVKTIVDHAKRNLGRKELLDFYVRINDMTQERIDAINDEIGREMHGERE